MCNTPYIFAYVPILSPYQNVQHLSKRKDDIFEDIALGNKNVYVKAAHHKLVNMASYWLNVEEWNIFRGPGVPGLFDWCLPTPNAMALSLISDLYLKLCCISKLTTWENEKM